ISGSAAQSDRAAFAPLAQIRRMTALSAMLDAKLLAFLLDVNSPMALRNNIQVGNAQHYEWELFIRTLTVSVCCATGRICSARLRLVFSQSKSRQQSHRAAPGPERRELRWNA